MSPRTTLEQAGQTRTCRTPSWAVERIDFPRLQWPRFVAPVRPRTVRNPLDRFAKMAAKIALEIVDLLPEAVFQPPVIVGDELRVEHARCIGKP